MDLHKDETMNKKRKIVILVAVIVLLVMTLIPPWRHSRSWNSKGYGLIFHPPRRARIDNSRLGLQYFAVVLAAGTIGWLFGNQSKNKD